jgi:hypothetical protein
MTYIFALLLIITIISLLRKGTPTLHANWNTLLDNFEFSTKDFYKLLTEELESHGIQKIKIEEKYINIGNKLSIKRLYLRVKWKNYTYDCCLAPYGNGAFVSWWMFSEKSGVEKLISKIPIAGNYLVNVFFPVTYYTLDTISMFRTYAQASVLKVIDDITKDTGVRISDVGKIPILNDFFKR